jgi:hypothetical protein
MYHIACAPVPIRMTINCTLSKWRPSTCMHCNVIFSNLLDVPRLGRICLMSDLVAPQTTLDMA